MYLNRAEVEVVSKRGQPLESQGQWVGTWLSVVLPEYAKPMTAQELSSLSSRGQDSPDGVPLVSPGKTDMACFVSISRFVARPIECHLSQ